jgi:outer membrane protein TolC
LKNIEQDYREGKVVYLDLITGLTALLNAKVNFFSTYFAAQQALAQYHFYEGTIADAVARF